jgi:hypothetical protein
MLRVGADMNGNAMVARKMGNENCQIVVGASHMRYMDV